MFDCTEVFRSVIPKNLLEWFFWVHLSHTKFSIHESIIEQIQTFTGTHRFQIPLVCPKGVRLGNTGYLIPWRLGN